jgi:hypothetical protein
MFSFLTLVGICGVVLVLAAYALLSAEKLAAHDPRYLWLNLIGTVGILASLLVDFNLAGIVTQCIWIGVSVVGLVRAYAARGKVSS